MLHCPPGTKERRPARAALFLLARQDEIQSYLPQEPFRRHFGWALWPPSRCRAMPWANPEPYFPTWPR